MKRIILTTFIALSILTINNAQVFNSAQTLKKGTFALGLDPTLIIDGGELFYFFIHAGYGIKSGMDMALRAGFGEADTYIGGDIEFAVKRNISLMVGAHNFYNFGLDGALLFNIPIKSDIRFYTGFDADINFDKEVNAPLWIPLGLEIMLKKKVALFFEAEIGLTDYNVLDGGVSFYF